MGRTAISLLCLLALACTQQDPQASPQAAAPPAQQDATPAEQPEWTPTRRKPVEVVREDLLAVDLPPAPKLEPLAITPAREGSFAFPEGTDELAPRAAVALRGGLLLAGQAYFERRPGPPPNSWRWLGFTPASGDAPSSVKSELGAIRAAVANGQGGALLCGTSGIGFDVRGWFGVANERAQLGLEVALDTPNSTEMFDLLPGAAAGELAVMTGYVDAQAWLVSLDPKGAQRWQKYIGSYGYTQARALVRLDGARGDLLTIGTRAKGFGESWWATIPGDGGDQEGSEDVTQDKLSIAGADQHQMLRAIVDVGEAGFIALGTAKRNHVQAHDQALAVGFGRDGAVLWTKVLDDLRISGAVTGVSGGLGKPGAGLFVVEVPGPDAESLSALALLEVSTTASSARELQGSVGWSSAGFVEGAEHAAVLTYAPNDIGIVWRELPIPE
ncbi:hypothetical protein DB30_00850 [Enhygromyxa salina]|uniref:Lipoprotein n=1 Tax=Enhygromyxa salina TaxID=215803 RepID=A0A0C2CP09_9BACT|nr:hypothetical protein [Enhygromyxa salina]KIG12966.1 hypothetical protein DB30_00850 [Enhygromyxa salina]